MRNLIMMLTVPVLLGIAMTGFAETVTNVRGSQRENTKLVDIYYDLESTDGGTYLVEVAIEGRTDTVTAATFSGDVGDGVEPGTNRHIVWDAGTDWRGLKGDVKAVVTATKEDPTVSYGKFQLWEGGPYWADRNIGADAPWEAGLYFWWGDTVGHRPSGTTFGFNFNDTPTNKKSTDALQSEGWITLDGVLAPSHDAAHVKWGGGWRIPTEWELRDLCNKCDWTWTTMNGVSGYIVRGRGGYASNSIFLPAAGRGLSTSLSSAGSAGYYLQSVPYSTMSYYGMFYGNYKLYFGSSSHNVNNGGRTEGISIRPVQ